MKQASILLAGALVSNLIFGSAANDEQQRALQRDYDLKDKTPISAEEARVLKGMVDQGRLNKLHETELPEVPLADLVHRGLKKGKKSGKDKKGRNRQPQKASNGARTRSQQIKPRTGTRSSGNPQPRGTVRTGQTGNTGRAGRTGPQPAPSNTKRHPHYNDDWYDDYFVYYDDNYNQEDDYHIQVDDYYAR
jgi:hypothetical protein